MAEDFRAGNSLGSAKLSADTRDFACISDVAKTQNSREGWLAWGNYSDRFARVIYKCTGADVDFSKLEAINL